MRRALLTLLLLSSLCPAALAEPPKPDPETRKRAAEQFRLGGEQFKLGSYDAAAALFKSAYDLVPDPAYLYNIGICYERRKAWRLAVDYFDKFLAVSQGSPLESDARARREVAAKSQAATLCTVEAVSVPPGARAVATTLGGTVTCEATPCKLSVEAGPVSIEFTLGSATRTLAQSLSPQDVWVATAEFKDAAAPKMAKVTIQVDVRGAVVLVDGESAMAGTAMDVPAGPHTVEVTKAGFLPFRQTVTLAPGQDWVVSANLQPEAVGSSPQKLAGWLTLGVSGAVLANGVIFAVLAKGADKAAVDAATGPSEDDFRDLKQSARTRALVADVSFGVAAAGVTTAIVLWLTSRDATETAREGAWDVVRF